MFPYNKYNIKAADKFNPDDYPKMVSELAVMNEEMAQMPVKYKGDIIISYLKDHSIKQVWTDANPKLTELMTSGSFPTSHMESLFESCQKNKPFLKDYEDYIKGQA